jgi:hypothetical protein
MTTPSVTITNHKVKRLRHSKLSYLANGLVPTRFVVVINNDKIWRRVYERWDRNVPSRPRSTVVGGPVPLIKVRDRQIDLTPEQRKQIGWDRYDVDR